MSSDKTEPLYLGHRERLRQEVISNLDRVPDARLLEHLLTYALPRRDTQPISRELMHTFGSLRAVLDADRSELLAVSGIGPRCADLWEVLRELRARYAESPVVHGQCLCDNKSVVQMARARLAGLKKEEIWAAFVDTGLHLLKWERLSTGTIDAAYLHAQEVVRLCLKYHAWGFILVHNHPAGGRPSAQDVNLSMQLEKAAEAVGIRMLEHIVIMDNTYCGLKEDGLIEPSPARP